MGVRKPASRPRDPAEEGRTAAGRADQCHAAGRDRALARHRPCQRHGRRARPDPGRRAQRPEVHLRLRGPRRRNILVPFACRYPTRPRPVWTADHRGPEREGRLRRRTRGRARRLDRRHRHQSGPGPRKPAQDRHEADGTGRPRRDPDEPARRGRRRRHLPLLRHQRPGSRPIHRWWITVPANGFGCVSSMPGRTPRSGWRYQTRR